MVQQKWRWNTHILKICEKNTYEKVLQINRIIKSIGDWDIGL